jgi:hypothetical protein
MRFEVGCGGKMKKKFKNAFCNKKKVFSLLLFLSGHLALHFKDDL